MFKHIYLLGFLFALLIAVVCWSQSTAGMIPGGDRTSYSAQLMGLGN